MSLAAIGWNAQLGLAEETTYGTPVTPSTHWLPIVSSSLGVDLDVRTVPFLSSGQTAFHNPREDKILKHDVGGDIETIAMFESTAFGLLLKYAFGTFSSGAGPPYSHTYLLDMRPADIEGLTIQQIDGEQEDLDMARVMSGCLVNTFEFEATATGFISSRFGIIGKSGAGYTAVSGTSAYPTAEEMTGDMVASFNWAANHVCTRFGVRVNRGLVRRNLLGSLTTDRPVPGGFAEVMAFGTMEIDENNQALYASFLAGTQSDATCVITGTSNNLLTINAHNGKLTRVSAPVNNAGVLTFDWEMRLKADASDRGLSFVLRNDLASPI